MSDPTIKGITPSAVKYDGSSLRIGIVHARWNKLVIDALLEGTIQKLKEHGVRENNIIVQSVPGSFELPLACSRMIEGSKVQESVNIPDLLSGLTFGGDTPAQRSGTPAPAGGAPASKAPFDAVIAIGVLIKGSTMHFEYICDSVSHALMKLQMDTGTPVIFGVLTALTEDQALDRAGIGRGESKGHNHGEDWAAAAVEMSSHCRRWKDGKFT